MKSDQATRSRSPISLKRVRSSSNRIRAALKSPRLQAATPSRLRESAMPRLSPSSRNNSRPFPAGDECLSSVLTDRFQHEEALVLLLLTSFLCVLHSL